MEIICECVYILGMCICEHVYVHMWICVYMWVCVNVGVYMWCVCKEAHTLYTGRQGPEWRSQVNFITRTWFLF